jgi:preprotein translocase subunit SecY
VFTFFYTAVVFDPKKVGENLQKMGGFIPGIRPGPSTVQFLGFVVKRVLLVGAVWLGIVAILPFFVAEATNIEGFSFLVGGTAVLIAVNVVLEMMRQIRAHLQMREYDTF